MIIRRLKQISVVILLLLLSFLWGVRSLYVADFSDKIRERDVVRATTVSRINLLMTELQFAERQALSSFLQQLDGISEISHWQLFDQQNKLIDAKKIGTPVGDSLTLYAVSDHSTESLLTLNIYFKSFTLQPALWSLSEFVYSAIFVFLLVGIIYWLLRSNVRLEEYAKYLLTDNNASNKPKLEKLSNPVNQVINQLILKNSLLNKDKLDLTEQIRKISYVDEVTELGNQLFFKAEFEVRLHNHEENESGLLMILSFAEYDEEDEKVLTDDLLRSIANLLKTFTQTIPNALVARLRANDFALLLPNRSQQETDQICKTLIRQLDKSIFDATSVNEQFIEIGISAYKQGFEYYKILAEADMALRNAQLQGGNNWYMYGEPLNSTKIRGNLRWKSFLQNVLEKRQLQLFGQQFIFFNQPESLCQEVLARIVDGKDVLTADTFLPMAHRCGLAIEFDRQVIDGVIKQCLYQESSSPQQSYSMNLFISSLLDDKFVSWLIKKLSSYPELSRNFIFELKECHVNNHLQEIAPVMKKLTEVGVGWCIEHFGSPEEDLTYLDILPIRSVKIDRRIVFDVSKNKAQQLLLKSLLINLKSRDIQVFAEGVEKAEDAEYLKKAGLDGAQGFYFCQPKRMIKLEKFLRAV